MRNIYLFYGELIGVKKIKKYLPDSIMTLFASWRFPNFATRCRKVLFARSLGFLSSILSRMVLQTRQSLFSAAWCIKDLPALLHGLISFAFTQSYIPQVHTINIQMNLALLLFWADFEKSIVSQILVWFPHIFISTLK